MNKTEGLYAALMRCRNALKGKVYKGGTNSAQKYNYVGHEQVIEVTRDVLSENELLLIQTKTEYMQRVSSHDESKGLHIWRGYFTLLHVPTGETLELSFEGTTVPNDKSAYVASTAIERTALLRLFLLAGSGDRDAKESPYVEDPESDHSGTDATLAAPKAAQPASAAVSQGEVVSEELTEALGKLAQCRSLAAIQAWFLVFDSWQAPAVVKARAKAAYEAHCISFGFKPGVVAQAARNGATANGNNP